jgi:hypothetical protein
MARYDGLLETVGMTPAQRALVDETGDPILRETMRDFMLDRRFRNDLWMKAPTVDRAAADRCLAAERFVRIDPQPALPAPLSDALSLNGHERLVQLTTALLAALPVGPPRPLRDLAVEIGDTVPPAQLVEAVALLVHANLIAAAQPAAAAEAARAPARRLNAVLLRDAADGHGVRHLASPVLGGGVAVSFEEQAALRDGTLAEPRRALLGSLGVP